ncbi:hypothetical protein BCV69DRAFT_107916 [Microstroma glucosiphilum]|uniref:Uncharacterized protein n=1 Tax=Pseudomicrostroma glucosiphilum TaxID=1684307 RepID=A0A316UCZ8_9BASI|nr:hypothetical protein BCV69DRAFT_107916 [Pseudomicrostroma glucosiphilum]PWN23100.1 hypothetical protein BCV69DRAFT_107916 [Pseudomicrostroma glucosiphilum]
MARRVRLQWTPSMEVARHDEPDYVKSRSMYTNLSILFLFLPLSHLPSGPLPSPSHLRLYLLCLIHQPYPCTSRPAVPPPLPLAPPHLPSPKSAHRSSLVFEEQAQDFVEEQEDPHRR